MQLLKTFRDQDVIPDTPLSPASENTYSTRVAARAVLSNDRGQIALLHVTRHGYHKLPGGGVEAGEQVESALARELLEEVGCTAEVTAEVGRIDEYLAEVPVYQQSYCFTARLTAQTAEPAFTAEELSDGFQIVWVKDLATAISLLEHDQPTNYDGKFVGARDLLFLRSAA